MTHSIVYSSQTGNTRLLAETLRETLPHEELVYFGAPSQEALRADRIYVGFWTDRGTCNAEIRDFLDRLQDQEIFLFGTAGFGGAPSYYEKIVDTIQKALKPGVTVAGSFLCQGKMPMAVRERYEAMLASPEPPAQVEHLIENFDQALTHPDQEDLEHFRQAVRSL